MLAYTLDWSETELNWIIDGTVVRTLTAASVGGQYPQTPMQVRLGTWCGGCSSEPEGTIQWAGGPTTFTASPYTMTITSLEIDNANPGGSYVYSDMSGSASSITIGGSIALPGGNDTIGAGASSEAVSLSQISVSAQSSSSDPPSSSSAAANSTTTTSTDPPTTTTGATQTGSQPITATIVNVGPTASTLPPNSEASRPSLSSFALFVLGAIILLAQ
jgi:beta-glucanase (GH16 family)